MKMQWVAPGCGASRGDPKISWAVRWLQALSITISPSIEEGSEAGEARKEEAKLEEQKDKGKGVYLHLGDGFTVE